MVSALQSPPISTPAHHRCYTFDAPKIRQMRAEAHVQRAMTTVGLAVDELTLKTDAVMLRKGFVAYLLRTLDEDVSYANIADALHMDRETTRNHVLSIKAFIRSGKPTPELSALMDVAQRAGWKVV